MDPPLSEPPAGSAAQQAPSATPSVAAAAGDLNPGPGKASVPAALSVESPPVASGAGTVGSVGNVGVGDIAGDKYLTPAAVVPCTLAWKDLRYAVEVIFLTCYSNLSSFFNPFLNSHLRLSFLSASTFTCSTLSPISFFSGFSTHVWLAAVWMLSTQVKAKKQPTYKKTLLDGITALALPGEVIAA